LLVCSGLFAQVSDLKSDEVVVFYPSYLTWDSAAEEWHGDIHGKVHEPGDGVSEKLKLTALRKLLGIPGELTVEEERIFRARAGEFNVDNEKGKSIVVRIGDRTFFSRRSRSNGRFVVEVSLAEGEAGDTLPFTANLAENDSRDFGGGLRLLASGGISVISDIDDTVKESNVLDRDALLANTFLRPYRAVPGMPELYAAWGDQGVIVHYVTGSPWQLYPGLWGFLEDHRFPGAEIQMRHLRLKDSSAVRFFRDPRRYKSDRIRTILRRFPGREFVLVGDSGERDPEIYAAMAREFPDRVRGIFIRAVLDEHRDRARYRGTFRGIDAARWIIFHDARALPNDLAAWCRAGEN
jgi:phosphatidate phosphatase APP1